ncbi:hypothetical protein [Pseudomonas sp. JG-B]|uniref:hypothetical protein n=1 Tax=Pseudomonas sp. JG-B TaxID=2603214 RepID=UPI00129EB50C|nr:hypothetical protein [Pseudomonas sp. JG-B]MRK19070.1 hypothetical protein [Pseudomonas sp. JG-B]
MIEGEFAKTNPGKVKRKANTARDIRVAPNKRSSSSSAARASAGAPEVMAKVTGFNKGASHTKAHFDYISRNGKVEVENERGEVFRTKEDVREFS